MARVSFSALIEEITGKLAGSVFQDSYGGYQIRTRVTPRNPQSSYQQLRRGAFGFISATWRNLTDIQRQTFIDAALTPPAALNLYIQSNVNLTLIQEPVINSYTTSPAPDEMIVEIYQLTPTSFKIRATGATTTVPAGHSLLIFATYEKEPTKIFTNPSQFSPIISFPAGTDVSVPTDITAAWQARYGQLREGFKICIKSATIDITNGNRTDNPISCATNSIMTPQYAILISQTGTADPTVDEQNNSLGAIVWTRQGVGLYAGTLTGAFTEPMLLLCGTNNTNDPDTVVILTRSTDDEIIVETYQASSPADAKLNDFPIGVFKF